MTYRTLKGVEKQLDYIMTDRKHYCWSRDAEANDMIHMRSDHSCVMARFAIPEKKRKARLSEVTPGETDENTKDEELFGQMCEDGFEARYKDLEQEVKDAEPTVKKQKAAATKAAVAVEFDSTATRTGTLC